MFEIDKGDTYEWTVTLGEPSNRTNKAESFVALYNRLSQPRIDEINEAIRQRMIASAAGESVDGMIDDMQLANEVWAGWISGVNMGGQPVEFTESLKQELISRGSFAAAIVATWNESIMGGRKKTSRTPQGIL
jgi:hypothetical protein